MAKRTTYKGKPKPYGKKGFFYESPRHKLSAKGIKTGKLSNPLPNPEPFIDLGFSNPEPEEQLEVEFEPLVLGAPETEAVVPELEWASEVEIAGDEIEVKQPKKKFFDKFKSAFERERRLKTRRAFEEVGAEVPEELDELEDEEFETPAETFGKFLADIFADPSSEDLGRLSNRQLEDLAVKLEAKDTMFGKPHNPFKEELFNRVKAQEEMKLQRAKVLAELEPSRQQIRREIAEIKKRAKEEPEGGFLSSIIKEAYVD